MKALLGAAFGLCLSAGFAQAAVVGSPVYQAPADVFGGYCPTCYGTSTAMGDDISLEGGAATLTGLTWDTSNFGADYDADINVTLYSVDLSGPSVALGSVIYSGTSTQFLTGGNGVSSRTLVEIMLPDVAVPGRFVYTISVLNNNGSTNWNMAGQLAGSAGDEDSSLAAAQVGTNNVLDTIWGDWDYPGVGILRELSMDSYQLAQPQYQAYADYSNVTPNVTFYAQVAPVPLPAALPLLAAGLGGLGLVARLRRKAG